MGEGNGADIETGDLYDGEPVWFYAWKVYHGSDLFVTEVHGEISERP